MGIRCKDGVILVSFLLHLSYLISFKSSAGSRCLSWLLAQDAGGLQGVETQIISKMLEKGSNRRTYAIDRHAGVVRPASNELRQCAIWGLIEQHAGCEET